MQRSSVAERFPTVQISHVCLQNRDNVTANA
jgi:hypothetical protein